MKIKNLFISLLLSAVFTLPVFSTEVTVVATTNGTIDVNGPRGNPWYHNAQGPGEFTQYGISSFDLSASDFGGATVTSVESVAISYTQANASFTTDGPVELFITFDPAVSTGDYAGLIHSGSGTGINDALFADTPSTQSLGTFTFTQVESGTVDIYPLDISSVQDALLAAINSPAQFSIILTSSVEGTAATYAGIQNNTYPNSITLTVSATAEGDVVDPDNLLPNPNFTMGDDGKEGWSTYLNVYDPTGAFFKYGTSWDTGTAVVGDNAIVLSAHPGWTDNGNGPLDLGDTMENNFYYDFGATPEFAGQTVEFSGSFSVDTALDPGTVATAFVKVLDGSWGLAASETADVETSGGTFSLTIAVPTENINAFQVGFAILATAGANGSIMVSDLRLETVEVQNQESGLMITGVMDGSLPGGLPKGIELYALTDIPDLSIYGLGSANNGGGTDGQEMTLEGSAVAGDFLYIATEETEFMNVWGIAPDFISDSAAINGDDAVELFMNGVVVDVFGDINVDGNGTAWEYLDSWAYRTVEGTPDGTFELDNWTFGGVDALDDLDAAGIAEAVPFGTYGVVDLGDPAMMITGVMDGTLPGGLPKGIELYVFADIPDLSIYGIGSANNGGGTDGKELEFSGSATAGEFIYIASDETEFTNVWGFAPDYVSDAAAINGDDALELFLGDEVIDVFGEIDVDGNGTAWEYLDSWAYRTVEGTPDGTFHIEDWTFGGVDALEGLDAAGIAEAVPFGYYPDPIPVPEPLPWEDAIAGDYIISPWFGPFEFSESGWLLHGELLWLYIGYVTDVDNMWVYSLYLNAWAWSSMDAWPFVYNTGTGSWVYFFNVENSGVWMYDAGTGEWTFTPLG